MKNLTINPTHVIGGGLAGCEAAWQLASTGLPVVLHEMRPKKKTFAHKTNNLAELVCSNSFRSSDHETNAVGLLHWEMKEANSIIMETAYEHAIPAGGALAVDRDRFSEHISHKIESHPLIKIIREEVTKFEIKNAAATIIATGPLSSKNLIENLVKKTDQKNLAFFDAIAPIVYGDTIDMTKTWFQSRYDKGKSVDDQKAYLNCPFNKEEYYQFVEKLLAAEKTEFHDWEKETPYFNGCLPIEVMAERGVDTLRFGPMKPIGLTNPHFPNTKPYAVIQLRFENKMGTLFNLVGFQTKMKHAAQVEVFRTIPGLENAKFARLGGIHRNTFINSPKILNEHLMLKGSPNVFFAGQITGVEGYIESAAIGLLVGRLIAEKIFQKHISIPPATTAMGALYNHLIDDTETRKFQPMNVNFGLFPNLEYNTLKGRKSRKERYKLYTARAKKDFKRWCNSQSIAPKEANIGS